MTRQSGVRAYPGTALFSLAAATLVALVISELARPQPLLISADAPGYLMPSISALSGQGFGHTYGRGFVYPLVVYGSILGSGDLSGIISIQVVLYWLMLVMLVSLIWIRVNSNPQAQRPTGSIILLTLVSLSLALDNLKAVLAEPEGWPLLGFNGDRCMYGDAFAALVNNFHANDVPSIRNFYTTMFVNSVLTEPALYLRKVSAQMADASLRPFWNAGAVAHATDSEARELTIAHKQYADLFAVPMNGSILGVMARYSPRIDRFMATLTERVLDRLALIAGCAALLCLWLFKSMGRPISATPALAIVVLTGAWLGQALTVALSHTFDVGRYFWASAPLLMGATFLAFSLLTQIISAFRAR